MLFSIVVPVYCAERFLSQCVRSILEQTCPDFELILVDDGSTDGSARICDAFAAEDARVRTLHQPNQGASAARNAGIRMAQGQYLLLADADDYLPDRKMLEELAAVLKEKDPDALLFEIKAWKQKTNRFRIRYGPFDYSILDRFDQTDTLTYLFSQRRLPAGVYSLCVKRSVLTDCGISFIEGIRSEDYDWILSVLLSSKRIYAIDRVYYVYREDQPESVTGRIDLQHLQDLLNVAAKWSQAPGISEPRIRREVRNYAAYLYSTGLVVAGGFPTKERKQAAALLKTHRGILDGACRTDLRLIRGSVGILGTSATARLLQRLYRVKLNQEFK